MKINLNLNDIIGNIHFLLITVGNYFAIVLTFYHCVDICYFSFYKSLKLILVLTVGFSQIIFPLTTRHLIRQVS